VVVVLWFGAQDVLEGNITPGRLSQFLLFAVLAASSLGELSQVGGEVAAASGAAERLFEILAIKPAIQRPAHPVALPMPARGEVAFESVGFAYPGRPDVRVLDGISIQVKRGEKVALVGPSGAGKSTALALIPRLRDVSAGAIRIDGADVRNVTIPSLRDAIAYVGQETLLFDDTIAANIRMGRPNASDAQVGEAAQAAAAADFIAALPDGFSTVVGPGGGRLSGGQRQRIVLARALLRNPRILLLDEATSALDAESEALVQEALNRLRRGRTTIIVAHRLSTVRDADLVVAMADGQAVERGTHAELMQSDGLYARLVKTQLLLQ
jgi:ATP-binding cassette subfamily B protein